MATYVFNTYSDEESMERAPNLPCGGELSLNYIAKPSKKMREGIEDGLVLNLTKDVVPLLLKEIADMMVMGEDKFYLSFAGKMQIKEGDKN